MESKLGRYEILNELGKGGMGIVYRGTDPVIGRTVAIKTIRAFEGGTESEVHELRARLLRESQAAGLLSHPNIVAVYDVGEQGDIAYVVMEYIAGRTLEQILTETSTPVAADEILRVLTETARALDYAHSKGVVHRDVKPANIMVQDDGVVKIADFGIAKVMQSSTVTKTSAVIGSPHYMAPEQLKGEPVGAATDQYALATVAYALLTGHRPFESDTMASIMARTLYEDPPSASSQNPALPAAVDEVLRTGLAKLPGARFASCMEFMAQLRNAMKGQPVTLVPPQAAAQAAIPTATVMPLAAVIPAQTVVPVQTAVAPPPAAAPKPKSRNLVVTVLGVLVVIAGGIIGADLYLRHRSQPQTATVAPPAPAKPIAATQPPVTPEKAPAKTTLADVHRTPESALPPRAEHAPPPAPAPATPTVAAAPVAKPAAPPPASRIASTVQPGTPSAQTCSGLGEWTPIAFHECLEFWSRQGVGPVAIAPYQRDGNIYVTALFQHVGSRLVSLLADPAERQEDFQHFVRQQYRPDSVQATVTPSMVRLTTVWVPRDGPFEIRPALLRQQFERQNETFRQDGLTIIDVTGYQALGPVRYAAIWAKLPQESEAAIDLPMEEVRIRNVEMNRRGFRVARVSAYDTNRGRLFAVVWNRRPEGGLWFLRLDRDTFLKRNAEAEARGYKLHWLSAIDNEFSAVWWKQ
jgi:predicted Ser/Thr protein kinase